MSLIIFAKRSTLDIWRCSEYTSVQQLLLKTSLREIRLYTISLTLLITVKFEMMLIDEKFVLSDIKLEQQTTCIESLKNQINYN